MSHQSDPKSLVAHCEDSQRDVLGVTVSRTQAVCILLSLAVLVWHLAPVCSDQPLAGWDTVPHYTLYLKFLDLLKTGSLSGYDRSMLGGFAEFRLYPPLGYLILALPHFITGGVISAQLSFNVMLALIPFGYLGALYWCAKQFFDRRVAGWALIVGALYLAAPPDFALMGVGLFALYWGGLIFSFLALPFLCLFLGTLERIRRTQSIVVQDGLRIIVTLGCLSLIHLLSTVMAAWIFLIYLCVLPWRSRFALLGAATCAAAAVSWWYLPFLRHLPYSSSTTTGLWGRFADPLFMIVPGISLSRLSTWWTHRFDLISLAPLTIGLDQIALPLWTIYLPFTGLCIAAAIYVGCRALLISRCFFLVTLTALTVLILPRDFLADGIESGIHFYRFIQPILILTTLLAAYGLETIGKELRMFHPAVSTLLRTGSTAVLLWTIVSQMFLIFSLENRSILAADRYPQYSSTHRLFLGEYPDAPVAERMLEYIGTLNPTGRIAVESIPGDQSRIGSPHYFNSLIAQRLGLSVLGGLLLESSPLTPLVMPTLYAHSEHLQWAERDLVHAREFIRQPMSSMLRRLQAYSVEYILTSSLAYQYALRQLPPTEIVPVKTIGAYSLFRVLRFQPYVYCATQSPALFVGTLSEFRDFSEIWYLDPTLLSYPVLFAPQGLRHFTPIEYAHFSAIISAPQSRRLDSASIHPSSQNGSVPTIFFGDPNGDGEAMRWIETRDRYQQAKQLAYHLKKLSTPIQADCLEAAATRVSDSSLSWNAHGLVGTTFGFAPDWNSSDGTSEVYVSAAGTLFTFSYGATELVFR